MRGKIMNVGTVQVQPETCKHQDMATTSCFGTCKSSRQQDEAWITSICKRSYGHVAVRVAHAARSSYQIPSPIRRVPHTRFLCHSSALFHISIIRRHDSAHLPPPPLPREDTALP